MPNNGVLYLVSVMTILLVLELYNNTVTVSLQRSRPLFANFQEGYIALSREAERDDQQQNVYNFELQDLNVDNVTMDLLHNNFGVNIVRSDATILSHCDLQSINTTQSLQFANRFLNATDFAKMAHRMNVSHTNITDEVILQSLELFARASGVCDFAKYKPTVPASMSQLLSIQSWATKSLRSPPIDQVRIVYCISAFNDYDQLQALVEAIVLVQHLIVIHLERETPTDYFEKVRGLANQYSRNVLVLQFGRIVYRTDFLSQIFLHIMRFITIDLNIQYDYFITLGASSYPLWEAHELALKLKTEERYTRIGTLVYEGNGARYCRKHATSVGIVLSRDIKKFVKLNGRNLLPDELTPFMTYEQFDPPNLHMCTFKTNSGNTAAFHREAIQSILQSPEAMSFLSRFKHSSECCNEEVSWGGALSIIGRTDDIPRPGAIYQGWPCGGRSMQNSVLTHNMDCMIVSDTSVTPKNYMTNASHLIQELTAARARGLLFARKFTSSDIYWRDWIRSTLHNSNDTDRNL